MSRYRNRHYDDDNDDDDDLSSRFGSMSVSSSRSGKATSSKNNNSKKAVEHYDTEIVHYTPATAPQRCICNKKSRHDGPCRVFAEFECHSCGREWTSAYGWYYWDERKPESQDCKECEEVCMPTGFQRLEISSGDENQGFHDSERCGRCRDLGRGLDCTDLA